jgi:hypothetical protein
LFPFFLSENPLKLGKTMPQESRIRVFVLLLILACAVFCVSCRPKPDEDQIRELMKEAGRHIEEKDIGGLMDLLSDDYSDHRDRDKKQTQDMVQNYFSEFRGIVVHILATRVDELKADEAFIRTDAALSSGAAKALRKLVPVSTDNYRFEIELTKKQDRWLIRFAEWKHIGIEELFPESISVLQRIFSEK